MTLERITIGTSLLGLVLVTIVALLTQPSVSLTESSIMLTLFALYTFTEFFPLKRNQLSISLSLAVDVLIFVKFGILPIVLLNQVVVVFARWHREKKFELLKTLANCGMFLMVQGSAAAAFFLAGGEHSASLAENFLPLIVYIFTHFTVNHIVLFLIFKVLAQLNLTAYLKRITVDLLSTLFAASLGFIVIMLYENEGLFGLLAFGIPMILSVYVFKLFNDLWRSSSLFRKLASLTTDFSGELDTDAMFKRVTEELPRWCDASECAIYLEERGALKSVSVSNGFAGAEIVRAFLESKSEEIQGLMRFDRLQDLPEFRGTGLRELLVAPFLSETSEDGYCVLASAKGNEFDATLRDGFSILANQLAVSYRNAMRYENMEKQSLYDELTQLPNHRFCERRLQEELMRFDGQTSLSLLLIDLDHFKKVNDTYGHLAGNVVLQQLARTFEACIRKSDFVARYGGEEFIVVLPGADGRMAREIGEKIRTSVEQLKVEAPTMDGETAVVSVTVSIGIATSPDDADSAQQLVRFADRAMYHGAKRAGRNRVASYCDDKKMAREDEWKRKEPLSR